MGIDKMNKWQQDLIKDIRYHDGFDDSEGNDGRLQRQAEWYGGGEVSEANRTLTKERFLRVRDNCQSILEIGVCRNEGGSITHQFLDNKLDDTYYFGIDLEDKTFLNNPEKRIYTLKSNSSEVANNIEAMKKLGLESFGFIFIDGLHSINQVLLDWEYTQLLAPNGIVGFHDTSVHPGPYHFIRNLNRDIWEVEVNLSPEDHGIGFAWKK
jgi:hypothetical protein